MRQTVTAASPFVPAVDHSRVELSLITSDADSHYINANFIKVLPFMVFCCATVSAACLSRASRSRSCGSGEQKVCAVVSGLC